MKKIYLSLLLGVTFIGFSQETTVNDALRYAVEDLNGTARFRGLSGAMGAIGGDLSAININPAGSVVFKYNTFSATVSSFNQKNNSTYFGTKSTETDNKLDLNQIGAVFVFDNTNESSGWKKMSLGINYENTNNFNNQIFSRGINPYNSIDRYFLNAAQNVPFNVLTDYTYNELYFNEQQTYLGYNSYLLEYDADNDLYYSNVPTDGNYYQESYIKSKGYNGKLTGNFATNYNDILSLGMNLNVHFTDFTKSSSLYESNNNPIFSDGSTVQSIQFNNDLYTFGRGFSLNLGAIAKVTQGLRLGLAYESPTWYRLTDQLTQSIITHSINNPDNNNYPRVNGTTIEYPSYTIQTPSKWTGSAAYIFGSKGFINIDVTTSEYNNLKFKPVNDPLFSTLNTEIQNNLIEKKYDGESYGISVFKIPITKINIGGEYKIKQISLRAGYRLEKSPYKVDYAMGDLIGYSGGLGYSFKDSRIDLSYANTHRNYNQKLISSGMNDQARIKNQNNNVSLSYTVSF